MRAEGIKPFVTHQTFVTHKTVVDLARNNRRSYRKYWWNPNDVLRVRAIRRQRSIAHTKAKAAEKPARQPKVRDREAATRKFRDTMLKKERRKILERIAARDGKDLTILLRNAGLTR
jgi:plasmid stability protein